MSHDAGFGTIGVSPDLCDALSEQGITEPFPIQVARHAAALAGRDICGKAKTGSGKTLAFGIAAIERTKPATPRHPRALVLVPTRELAVQVAGVLSPLAAVRNLTVVTVYGGDSIRKQAAHSAARATSSWPPPAGSSTSSSGARSTSTRSTWSSSTRPTAWPTWASPPR